MKILLFTTFILFFIATFSTTSADDISCDCTTTSIAYPYFIFVKTCTVKSKFTVTKADTTIKTLNGNKDANFFYVVGKTVQYIPKGLDQVFTNLTGMKFELTKLKHVTKENLAPFPQLLMFSSVSNQIQFIEQDLFINNPKLKFVSFRSNKISYIDPKVFEIIGPNLAQLYMDGFTIATNNDAVSKVLEKLNKSDLVDIDNAPPLYQFWLDNQGGSGNNELDCADELAKKDDEIQQLNGIIEDLMNCINDPNTCPSTGDFQDLLKKFKK